MKVIDCFTFYNELELLDYRLNVLKNVVDYTVIVEANLTHVGKPKKMYFDPERYSDFKIIYVVVDDFPYNEKTIDISKEQQWENEKHQRNCIERGLSRLKLTQDDILVFSDLDEIPNPRTLKMLKGYPINEIYSLEQELYYCTLNNLTVDKWYYSKVMTFRDYFKENCTIDKIRFKNCNAIRNGGWHLSYFGSPRYIANKIKNFVHQEFNDPCFTDESKILSRIENGQDLFDRPEIKMKVTDIYKNGDLPYKWYLLTKTENPLKEYYLNRCGVPSDINEHLPTLLKYSMECESIFETGVRGIVSTYAFAYGLQQNNSSTKTLILNDIVESDVSELLGLLNGIKLETIWGNNLNIELNQSVDLTFIDTWHVYGQLKRELNKFKGVTKKYIILHDTFIDSVYGESIRMNYDILSQSDSTGIPFDEICKGLGPAISEFLIDNPEWVIHERFTNNNGLTVLKKVLV
jgi:beta-1,4-mannosyl-glycoprotein beta-1,4-N-acetylglucosaminyltransferase